MVNSEYGFCWWWPSGNSTWFHEIQEGEYQRENWCGSPTLVRYISTYMQINDTHFRLNVFNAVVDEVPLTQYLVEKTLQPQVFLGVMWQALQYCIWKWFSSDPLKLCHVGYGPCVDIFRGSTGFKPKHWLGHSRTLTELFINHSSIVLAVCLGSVLLYMYC